MHLPHVGLGFTRIARHRRVTHCLGSPGAPLRPYTRTSRWLSVGESDHSLCSIAPQGVPQPDLHCPRWWSAKSVVGYASSASSSAFAFFRSGVSKPSVNQA
jgi:hypothetical protein